MINLQIEIFLLIVVGLILSKTGLMSSATRKQLTKIVLTIVLPCSIIQSFEIDVDHDLIVSCIIVFLVSVMTQFIYWLFNCFLWKNQSLARRINLQYGTMVSNAGFMGMPLAQGVFGDIGLLYASIFLIPQRVCMWSYGLSLYTTSRKQDLIKNVLFHPCIIAIFIGVLLMIGRMFGFVLPEALDDTIGAIASCNTALSMIAIGGILSDVNVDDVFDKTTLFYSMIRLIVLPLVLLIIVRFLNIDILVANVCVLLSGMPAASTTAMLAQTYDKDPVFSSKLVFVSTLFSLFTLPLLSMLLGG